MKKLQIAAVMAATVLAFTGCNGARVPKANMNNALDSLSYMHGLAQGNSMKDYLLGRNVIDSANLEDFIQGFLEGTRYADDKSKDAYCQGEQFGRSIKRNAALEMNHQIFGKDSTKTISMENLLAGMIQGLSENDLGLTPQEMKAIIEEKDSIVKADCYAEIRKSGMEFLAENAKKEGVTVTESGLQYRIITEGSGELPTEDSYVSVKYIGKFVDGTEFDNSNGDFYEMHVKRNIKGVKEALLLMPVGSIWEIYIPYHLAYGNEFHHNIKPYSTLIFEVEVGSIR